MTEDRLPPAELLEKAGETDLLRAAAEGVVQLQMEADVEGLIGARRHERTAELLNYRNGYRDRMLDSWLGTLQLRAPKLRQGSHFPPFLEPRKAGEKALVAAIQEAWGSAASRSGAWTGWSRPWACRASARARSRSCARTSTSGSRPSWRASGPTCGWTRPTEGPRGRPDRAGGGENRRGGRCRGPARDRRPSAYRRLVGTFVAAAPEVALGVLGGDAVERGAERPP